jgi:hypothetical protein
MSGVSANLSVLGKALGLFSLKLLQYEESAKNGM